MNTQQLIDDLRATLDELAVDHEDLDRLAVYLYMTQDLGKIADLTGDDLEDLGRTETEHFSGEYDSPAEFAAESLTEAYSDVFDGLPDWLADAIEGGGVWSDVWDRWLRFDYVDYELITPDSRRWLFWHAH